MKQFINRSVTLHPWICRKFARFRMCMLMALVISIIGLAVMDRPAMPGVPAEAPAAMPLSGLTVALDPGHGGYDGGARAHDSGVWEKALTLQIALAVEQELCGQGARVVLTRREDVCLSEGNTASRARKRADLQARRDLAEAEGADVLLSIHLNEYRNRAESGPQVFYQRGADAGRLLAGAMQEALIAVLKPAKERKALPGDYYVLRGKLPSVLVECGFLSNAGEERLLLSEAYQKQIAVAVAQGLSQWRVLCDNCK